MRKLTEAWNIATLRERVNRIHFPEYQREPNVWGRDAKQRLVDSIARDFDIASFYLYVKDDGSWDCVDGRQRIGAIMAFLNEERGDKHRGFEFRIDNEIYSEEENPNGAFDGMSWCQIVESSDDENPETAQKGKAICRFVLGLSADSNPTAR